MALTALKDEQALAQCFDVHPNQLSQWKDELLQRAAEIFATAFQWMAFSERGPLWFDLRTSARQILPMVILRFPTISTSALGTRRATRNP